MNDTCTIELNIDGRWHEIGIVHNKGKQLDSFKSPTDFSYNSEYCAQNFNKLDYRSASVLLPVNFNIYSLKNWPSFLLDLVPAGAAKKFWANRLHSMGIEPTNWNLLCYGACNPPGALRIKEAASLLTIADHPGFNKEDILQMKEEFIYHSMALKKHITLK